MVASGTAVAAAGVVATTGLPSAEAARPHTPTETPQGIWLAGDTHVHDDHSSDGSLPRQTSKQTLPGNLPVADQIGQGESMLLDFMPLTDHRTYDQHWDPQWTSSKLLLIPGEEANGSPHAVVLGAIDVVVDGANPPGSASFRHVQQSIWDVHAQNAFWSVAHPDDGEYTPEDGPNDNASAQAVNTIEIYNIASDPDVEIDYAENRWNRGFRTGVAAACDCHFREVWFEAGPGQPTTWVFAADRSVRAILDAFKAGRTTISNLRTGPFLTIEADVDGDGVYEAMGGDEVSVHDSKLPKGATVRIRAQRAAGVTLYVFQAPGRSAGPLTTFTPSTDDETFLLPLTMTGDQSWIRVEGRSPGANAGLDSDPTLPDQLRAATSPIYLSVQDFAEPQPELPLPAPLSTDDKARAVFGQQGEFAGFADIATVGDVLHVVAETHADHVTSVVYQRMDAHGHVDATTVISGDSPTARFGLIAARGNDVWVVWEDEKGQEQPHRPAIYLRHSTDAGKTFQAEQKLSNGLARSIQPTLTLLPNGHLVVAWADNSATAFDVYVQVIGVDAAPVNVSSAGKVISNGDGKDARSPRWAASLFPSVAAGPDGGLVVTWQDDRFDPDPLWTGHTPPAGQPASGGTDPDNWQILASVRPAGSASWGAPLQLSKATDMADRHPSVVTDEAGAFVVAWESSALQSSGVNIGLRTSRSTDGGLTWTAWAPLALEPNAMSQRVRLSNDADGSVRAVWYDSRSTDWRWKIFTARRTASGGWGAESMLSTLGNGTFPAASQGYVVFTSDRDATRIQRDITQLVYLVQAK